MNAYSLDIDVIKSICFLLDSICGFAVLYCFVVVAITEEISKESL